MYAVGPFGACQTTDMLRRDFAKESNWIKSDSTSWSSVTKYN